MKLKLYNVLLLTEVIENKDVQYGDLSDVKLYQIKTEQIPETKVSPDRTTQERKGPAPVKCKYLHLVVALLVCC